MARRRSAITSAFLLLPSRGFLLAAALLLGLAVRAFFARFGARLAFVARWARLAGFFGLLAGALALASASRCSAAQTRAAAFFAGPSLRD